MPTTAELLTAFEECPRKACWLRQWAPGKLAAAELLAAGIRAGVSSARTDTGQAAGEEVYGLGNEPGLDTAHYDLHGEVVHLAAIADIVTAAIRKTGEAPWGTPQPAILGDGLPWVSGAYLSPEGGSLRRVVLASAWNEDRRYSEGRSWFSLGEAAAYGLPMQMAVIVLGAHREGKYHGPWAKGLRHPLNKKLRFRKKHAVAEGFKNTWREVWREDFDEISTRDWLQAMLEDGVLQDACFTVRIEAPEKTARQRIVEMAGRKLERLAAITELSDPQLTGCDWPAPCLFRRPCHGGLEPSGKSGFVEIDGQFSVLSSQ